MPVSICPGAHRFTASQRVAKKAPSQINYPSQRFTKGTSMDLADIRQAIDGIDTTLLNSFVEQIGRAS